MKGTTHILFGLFLSLLSIYFFDIHNKPIFIILTIIFSLIPDIDHTNSKAGKKIWPLSFLIKHILGHRTIFHSFTLVFLISSLLYIFKAPALLTYSFTIGFSSHLILDSLTPAGIKPLWPIPLKIRGPFRTSSLFEYLIQAILFFTSIYFILDLFV